MAGQVLHKRNLNVGAVPQTSSLLIGEIALNIPDGKAFMRKQGTLGDVVATFVTTETLITGSIFLTGTINLQAENSGANIFATASWAETASYLQGGGNATIIISSSVPPTSSISGTLWYYPQNGAMYVQLGDPTGSEWESATKYMATGSVTASLGAKTGFVVDSAASGSTFTGSVTFQNSDLNIITGSIYVNSNTTGSNVFATASYAVTASIAFTTIVAAGATKFATVATASLTWSLSHSLGTTYPNVDVYNVSNSIIIPRTITAKSDGELEVTFTTPTAGTVVASVGGGLPPISTSFANYVLQVDNNGFNASWRPVVGITGSNIYAETSSYSNQFTTIGTFYNKGAHTVIGPSIFTGSFTLNNFPVNGTYRGDFPSHLDTWVVVHNLNNDKLMVQCFDYDGNQFFPEKITRINSNRFDIKIGFVKDGWVIVK